MTELEVPVTPAEQSQLERAIHGVTEQLLAEADRALAELDEETARRQREEDSE